MLGAFASLLILSSGAAAAETRVAVEMPAISTGLRLEQGPPARLDLPMMADAWTLSRGRHVAVAASAHVPGRLVTSQREISVQLSLGAARGRAGVGGSVTLERAGTLTIDGALAARFSLHMQADLHGLGAAKPHITLVEVRLEDFAGTSGALRGWRAAAPSVLAIPAAPIIAPVGSAALSVDDGRVRGSFDLPPALSPQDFGPGPATLVVHRVDGSAEQLLLASIQWKRADGHWRGRLDHALSGDGVSYVALRLGDADAVIHTDVLGW